MRFLKKSQLVTLAATLVVSQACGKQTISSHQPPAFSHQPLLELHNTVRQQGRHCPRTTPETAPKLSWSTQLTAIAHNHSENMAAQKQLSHKNPSGNTGSRLTDAGYQWRSYAENIARGVLSHKQVFELWLNSPQHCRNMLNPRYTEMGAAQVNGYWTAIYAKPQ